MLIGIDARFLTHPQNGGFKTYTKNLVQALSDIDTRNEYILYVDREPEEPNCLPQKPNFMTRVLPGTTPLIGMAWREQYSLPRHIGRDGLDLFHSPCLTAPLWTRCPLVVTIHDMIWYLPDCSQQTLHKEAKRQLMSWYYRRVPEIVARHATAVITVSYDARDSILRHLPLNAEQIYVTHEAAGTIFRPIDDRERLNRIRQAFGLGTEFVLAIGSADPRKNLRNLVLAYAELPAALRATYHLVIVWTHPLLSAEIERTVATLGLEDSVEFLQGVGDEDLVGLYNIATLFVFPSLREGFGLPPLEAMACGTPVSAADNSSIPEIVGDAAVLFNAEINASITDALHRVLTDEDLQAHLSQIGLERARQFSWTQCAHETLQVYRSLAAQ